MKITLFSILVAILAFTTVNGNRSFKECNDLPTGLNPGPNCRRYFNCIPDPKNSGKQFTINLFCANPCEAYLHANGTCVDAKFVEGCEYESEECAKKV